MTQTIKIFLLLTFFSAAGVSVSALTVAADAKKIVFPPPPDKGRVEWIMSLDHTNDVAGAKPSFFTKVWWAITGRTEMEGRVLTKPFGVAVKAGRIYVSDTIASAVVVFDKLTGKVWPIGRKSIQGSFGSVMGIDLDEKGNLYAVDSMQAKVKVFGVDGNFKFAIGVKGTGPGELKRPLDVAYDRFQQRIAVADGALSKVVFFDLKGKYLFEIGKRGNAGGEFLVPVSVVIDKEGRLLVLDTFQCRVQFFDSKGVYTGSFGQCGDSVGYFMRPKGIAVDSNNNIYVVDSQVSLVQTFDPTGRLLMAFGRPGSVPGTFQIPSGIYIDADDKIYVADTLNARVEIYQILDGRIDEKDKKDISKANPLAQEGWDLGKAAPTAPTAIPAVDDGFETSRDASKQSQPKALSGSAK